jgi:hypothetical protein
LVERLIDKILLGNGIVFGEIGIARQRPEVTSVGRVVNVNFEGWVEGHHFSDKVGDEVRGRVGVIFLQAKLRLDGIILGWGFGFVKDCIFFVVIVIVVVVIISNAGGPVEVIGRRREQAGGNRGTGRGGSGCSRSVSSRVGRSVSEEQSGRRR